MFHTLDELKKQEEETKKKKQKSKSATKVDRQNKLRDDISKPFDKKPQKMRLILYKNGFILNNEKFRDKSLPENQKFLEDIQKGQIPLELKKKGYKDLGIILENHRNETFYPYQQNNFIEYNINDYNNNYAKPYNYVTYNNNFYSNGKYNTNNYFNYNDNNIINNNYYNNYQNEVLKNNIYDNNYNDYIINNNTNIFPNEEIKENINYNNNIDYYGQQNTIRRANTSYNFNNSYNNNFYNNTVNNFNTNSYRLNSLYPKNEQKSTSTYRGCFTEKRQRPENQIITLNLKNEEEENEEENQFKAFTGNGKQVGNVILSNLPELKIDKCVTPQVNMMYPVCKISIRLFNGEIVNVDFNYMSTLREVYLYVMRVSKCNNFTLLEGFPPRPLRDLNRTIWELNLQNSTLTQKIY